MTVNNLAKAKLSGNMDLFGPDFSYTTGSDHVLPNSDLPMYAASPNSLYLYEQERFDMQHLGNTQCYTSPQSHVKKENIFSSEEFDLNPQYEANLELSNNSITDTDVQPNFTPFSAQSQSGRNSNPTLTELNMGTESESFLEDLEAVIPKTPSFSLQSFPSVSQQNNTFTTLTPRTNDSFVNNNYGLKTISSWPSWSGRSEIADRSKTIQNIKTALQNSKSLPIAHTITSSSSNTSSYSEDNKSRLQLLLMADDSPVTSVAGVKRPLLSIKEEKDDDSVEEKWREIEKYIHEEEDDEDVKDSRPTREKRKRFDSGSSMTGSFDDSNDDDSSDEEFSDGEMDMSHLNNTSVLEDGKKGEKFFWQYNVQSKGPKGTKLKLHLDSRNPHKLKNFEDPVFDPNNTKSGTGIRHGGKARKGDGNDIVPSPRKLYSLGVQIRKLNHMINEISAHNDQPASIRNESRKKKNKLASRACRLKKKAQHEANKVKLFGIGKEHSQLIDVIKTIKGELKMKAKQVERHEDSSNKENLLGVLDGLIANKLNARIAGNTTVYVNSVIKTVEGGDMTGGIPNARK